MTPREAEMRAGKGSRKSWKLTLMTMHAGQEMSLQKYFTLLGVERPGQEGLPRVDTAAPAAAEPHDNAACKTPWVGATTNYWQQLPCCNTDSLPALVLSRSRGLPCYAGLAMPLTAVLLLPVSCAGLGGPRLVGRGAKQQAPARAGPRDASQDHRRVRHRHVAGEAMQYVHSASP